MIELPRSLARHFRAVLRRCLLGPGSRGLWPVVVCRAGRDGLTLQAAGEEVTVRHHLEGARPTDTLAFRGSLLTEFEGRNSNPVTLQATETNKALARWEEGGVPRVMEFSTEPDSLPSFPQEPRDYTAMPEPFLTALAEGVRTTAPESGRLALSRLQLRGRLGEVVATDGKQLLVQGDFSFPWDADLLVPRLPIFGSRDLPLAGPVHIGRTDSHVTLRVGAWLFLLRIDRESRFPDVGGVIPKPSTLTTRLRLHPEDATFLLSTLPRLPGKSDQHSPVTLDLGEQVTVRARADGQAAVTEVVLRRSSMVGKPVRLHLDRNYLLRLAQMGFTEVGVATADRPLLCRDDRRTYVFMPLGADAAIPPGEEVLRIPSTETAPAPSPRPRPERRTAPMPTPSSNGQPPDKPRATPPPGGGGGLDELIAEAEALRGLLSEALTRNGRLVAALKQFRKEARAVRAAVASLRQLQLDR